MKFNKLASLWVLALIASLLVIFGFKPGRVRGSGQTKAAQQTARESTASDAGIVRLSAPAKASPRALSTGSPAMLESAARENQQLQANLGWNFGGRQQRGWSIYAPLIANLIEADLKAPANEFAGRLSVWQKENGFEPTGVLDGNTWSRMVSAFQSRRITARTYPPPCQLITIPISDCYDPTRAEELRKVEAETFAAYKRLVAAAAADRALGLQVARDGQLAAEEKFLKIVSAFRSREYQDQLRKQSPNSGRAGLAVNSPHKTGRALDLYVGGEPVSTKDANRTLQTRGPVYRWLVKNAVRFGFQPYFYEPWHWEYIGK